MNETVQTINLSDYTQTGEGGTAITYTKKDEQSLAKLYKNGFEADRAKAEFLTARAVYDLGIPSPKPYRLITDGERSGAEPRPPVSLCPTTPLKCPTYSTWYSMLPCPIQLCKESCNYFSRNRQEHLAVSFFIHNFADENFEL